MVEHKMTIVLSNSHELLAETSIGDEMPKWSLYCFSMYGYDILTIRISVLMNGVVILFLCF